MLATLFDPAPKESRRELFDREKELSELESYVRSGSKVALVLGVRRIGKTSLLRVFANECGHPCIFIDARRLSEYGYSKIGFYRVLSEGFSKQKDFLRRAADYLRSIRGVRFFEAYVEFDWREKELSISSVLEKLDEYAEDSGSLVLVIIDEAQELRFLRGYGKIDIRKIIAYSYDNLRRVKFILSGSEVGVLHEFLGFSDYQSPLYGRAREIVSVERFPREKSLEFLEAGFREVELGVSRSTLEKVVDVFDGIPGWLTLYGYTATRSRNPDVVDQVVEEAVGIALDEISSLTRYSQLYKHVLKAIAMGYRSWKNIKYFVESHIGRPIYDKSLYQVLQNLIALNIIEKHDTEYKFVDPLYREASLRI